MLLCSSNPWVALAVTVAIYAISIGLALSPLGEFILRRNVGARPIATQKDKDYLLPIFESVYNEVLELNPKTNKNIKLYIAEDYTVNAFAVGRNTIVLNRGAIEGFSEDELKGVLGHEFGHLSHGDTKALLLTTIGNGLFSLILGVTNIFISIIKFILGSKSDTELALLFIKIMVSIVNGVLWLVFRGGDLLLSLNSRENEYRADLYAYELGLAEGLIEALYKLSKITPDHKQTRQERLLNSHPYTNDRIERLEILLENEE